MPTSALYISVNNCKNQPPKAMQPATKQSAGLFLPICKQIWSSLSLVRVTTEIKENRYAYAYRLFFGSPSWTRTNDPAVNSRMLYQLSY